MTAVSPVRGLVVYGDPTRLNQVSTSFEEAGGVLVHTAASVSEVLGLIVRDEIGPHNLDVVLLGSETTSPKDVGRRTLDLLLLDCGLVRTEVGVPAMPEDYAAQPDRQRLVTVGISSIPGLARRIGSYSAQFHGAPLEIVWSAEQAVDSLAAVLDVVRDLKPVP